MPDEILQQSPRPSTGLEVIDVCGELVIWDPEVDRVHRLDPVGTALWRFLDGSTTIAELADDASAVWGISADEAREAVVVFVSSLQQMNLLAADSHLDRA